MRVFSIVVLSVCSDDYANSNDVLNLCPSNICSNSTNFGLYVYSEMGAQINLKCRTHLHITNWIIRNIKTMKSIV